MRTSKLAALIAAPLLFAGAAHAAAEKHYDCSKAGNANKAACKGAVPAAAPAPAPAVTKASTTTKTAAKATTTTSDEKTRSAAQLANDNKMKACGAKWRGLSAADKARYEAKGKTIKDKNGKPETGWIVYSVECRKTA